MNQALLGSWIWKLGCGEETLWKEVIRSKYGTDARGWSTNPVTQTYKCSVWKGIMQVKEDFMRGITIDVGREIWGALMNGVARPSTRVDDVNTIQVWFQEWPQINASTLGNQLWKMTLYAVCWIVWKTRNSIIFEEKNHSVERACVAVKSLLWYWCIDKPERRGKRFSELLYSWGRTVTGVG
ncbi:hypothetical protein FRX31_030435 [Thalictrum thalictroides]|uniref:Uncharacterized protein n=1 Tax=Thalictrum thalictroides TaxID=46969 RepID=A0A7J6V4I8_THATH|nr:hypothetical protein FRX31_030435 [Thalictrum thalictroides]